MTVSQPVPVIQLVDGFATEEQSGGAGLFGIQLARHLDRARFQPFVVGLWRYGTPSEQRWRNRLADEGIETVVLVEKRGKLSHDMLRAAARLLLLLDRTGARVINSHFERGDMLGGSAKLVHRSHPRIVRTQHADQQWQNRPWLGVLMNLAYPWVHDGEVAISQATSEVMDRRVSARLRQRHAAPIYNGIGEDVYQRLSLLQNRPYRQLQGAPRFIIIGRLERQKNHADAFHAMSQVLRLYPKAELGVVGHGSMRDELERLAQDLGIASAVRFLGQRSDIPELLAEADVLVSSSIWEGFPTVILEAMAAGVPVIATDVSGSRELVRTGATGLLVPMRDGDKLAQAMCSMIEQPHAAARMARAAAQLVTNYTFTTIARQYESLYNSILS